MLPVYDITATDPNTLIGSDRALSQFRSPYFTDRSNDITQKSLSEIKYGPKKGAKNGCVAHSSPSKQLKLATDLREPCPQFAGRSRGLPNGYRD